MCTRKIAYEGLAIGILVYCCETWSLPKQQLNRLQMFHNSCVRLTVRAMCRVTMWHVREHKIMITQVSPELRMQLEPFEYYLGSQRLPWAGHVSIMPFSRLPCMFLG